MISENNTIAERMPVWTAMSELFLDTELLYADRIRIARILAASPYSESKLEEIMRFEVSPVLKWNLFDIAGEWAGFNEVWLQEKLSPRIDKRPLIRFPIFGGVRAPWREIVKHVKSFRTK